MKTVAELIELLLGAIRRDFYGDRHQDFFRDKRALTKAIARYGVECHSRGWEFSVESIRNELLTLLQQIRDQKADVKYLPAYLEGAVDRHIRFCADDLAERNKMVRNLVEAKISTIKPAAVRLPTPVEILDALHKDMSKQRRRRKAIKAAAKKTAQRELL
jgi:hypothetical protein